MRKRKEVFRVLRVSEISFMKKEQEKKVEDIILVSYVHLRLQTTCLLWKWVHH